MSRAGIRNLAPFVLVAIGLVTLVLLAAHNCRPQVVRDDAPKYTPLELREFTIEPAAFRAGESIKLTDGLCNRSDTLVTAQFWLTLIREDAPLMADPIFVVPVDSNPNDEVLPPRRREPIKAGECLLETPLVAPAPQWAPGVYHLFVDVVAMGESGEEQRIQALSNTFRVLSVQE